jgi:hypothetical protein
LESGEGDIDAVDAVEEAADDSGGMRRRNLRRRGGVVLGMRGGVVERVKDDDCVSNIVQALARGRGSGIRRRLRVLKEDGEWRI